MSIWIALVLEALFTLVLVATVVLNLLADRYERSADAKEELLRRERL